MRNLLATRQALALLRSDWFVIATGSSPPLKATPRSVQSELSEVLEGEGSRVVIGCVDGWGGAMAVLRRIGRESRDRQKVSLVALLSQSFEKLTIDFWLFNFRFQEVLLDKVLQREMCILKTQAHVNCVHL